MSLELENEIPSTSHEHTILIVDDNPTNLGVLSNYLKGSGFRILVARSGDSALKKVEFVKPDLILLDVMMPGLNGFETCQKLKENEATQDIPVIFMTALAEPEDKINGFKVGAVDYVIKPLHHAEVLARVNTHLRIRDLTRNLQQQNLELQETTQDLQEANNSLLKQTIQLETSSQVARQATSTLNLDELLEKVVQLIQVQFGYYFVGVWLLDSRTNTLALRAHAHSYGLQLPKQNVTISLDGGNSIVTWVYRNKRPYLADDVRTDANYLPSYELPDTGSELVMPLHIGQKIIGILDIHSRQVAAFSGEDQVVLQTLADQIAIAIRNAELYKAEQRRRRLSETLEETGRMLSSNLDLHQAPSRILELLSSVVPYERGSVMLQQGNELEIVSQRGYPDDERAGYITIPISDGDVYKRIAESRQYVLIDDVSKDVGWRQLDWLPMNHSWLGVPLIAKHRVIGMISLTRPEVGGFDEEDANLVLSFAAQSAIALENASLYDQINQLNAVLEQKVALRTEELNKTNHILERLNTNKTDFIKVTSHELRTPITVIKGYTQLLNIMPGVSGNANAKELLEGIVSGVDRMYQIVNVMLDVVKIDTQELELRAEPVVLGSLLQKVKSRFQAGLKERQLMVEIDDLKELPIIEAAPDLLDKVFYNLLMNAIKYTPDGGKVWVSGQAITETNGDEAVEIVVSDTGIGIDPTHHEQIFEKFYQTGSAMLHSTGQTNFKGGGPGLGLAIVKGIIQAHGGRVWAESVGYDEEKLQGSHFHVVLPLKQAKP